MKHFRKLTSTCEDTGKMNAEIMGRKTWESIPIQHRPLSKRYNVILSRNSAFQSEDVGNCFVADSFGSAMQKVGSMGNSLGDVFVIGGGEVYSEAIRSESCRKVHFTAISESEDSPKCDTFFPEFRQNFHLVTKSEVVRENGVEYCFELYERDSKNEPKLSKEQKNIFPSKSYLKMDQNLEEKQYLDLIRNILENGALRGDRTGTGTLSIFGAQMRFSLRNGRFPLLTTKKVFWRGLAEELLWFASGCTNAKVLQSKNIHIWDGNGSREFLDKLGMKEREEGDLGPVYGFQWRHFGAKYENMHSDYRGKGIDQLQNCIDSIKNSPNDRRIVMSAWNPCDLDQMVLPPCHMFCQFYVAEGELSCQMYQRSADMGLGVPFNIASYSLLTCMVAQVCGLKPGEFIHTIGDAHVYTTHVDALKEQLKRVPRSFPTLKINPSIDNIDSFNFDDFIIEGYDPMGPIKMKMAV